MLAKLYVYSRPIPFEGSGADKTERRLIRGAVSYE
jgi:hypothetical protein